MRIIGGALRGRRLAAPPGEATRPSADRVRQALFDMLLHAGWAPNGADEAVVGARVLDGFAGTGALGLEALSRGAGEAVFFETDAAARRVLAANIAACGLGERARVIAADATRPPIASPREACTLVLLDPPYADEGIAGRAVAALGAAGWIAEEALIVLEAGAKAEAPPLGALLAERRHGAARLLFFRAGSGLQD